MSGADLAHEDHDAPGVVAGAAAGDAPGGQGDTHGDGHGDGHGEGHGEGLGHGTSEALGPVDWRAWGAGALGIASGLLVALVLYAGIHPPA